MMLAWLMLKLLLADVVGAELIDAADGLVEVVGVVAVEGEVEGGAAEEF